MNQFPVLNFQEFIFADGDALFTTSMHVAAAFKKHHRVVLKAIRDLCAQLPPNRLHNFVQTVEMRENPSGGALIPSDSYQITRDGFTWLAMRFRGAKALAFQVAYTDAFNAMAAYIKNKREGLQYQLLQKEIAFTTRKKGVSASARDMRAWQDDRPEMLEELNGLLVKMQPSLLPN